MIESKISLVKFIICSNNFTENRIAIYLFLFSVNIIIYLVMVIC